MSERVGSVRDARFLSGADIGRVILLRSGRRATILGVIHQDRRVIVQFTPRWNLGELGHDFDEITLRPHDAVTITGADH